MLSRAEQKALFDSLKGDLVIDTKVDNSGDNITIPVHIYWGFEPITPDLPAIFLKFDIIDNPIEKTLGDLWSSTEEGDYDGFIGENVLNIRIMAVDFGEPAVNFISKIDIADALVERVKMKAFHVWDSLIDNGSVSEDGISQAIDVSEVFGYQQVKEYQMNIKFKKLTGGIPVEEEIKFSTAPTILSVQTKIIKY